MPDRPELWWPTPILERDHPDASALNASLLALCQSHASQVKAPPGPTWASDDDLLARYPEHAGLRALFGFLSDAVFDAARAVNEPIWAQLGAPRLQISIVGAWMQRQNQGGRHGVHNHGNASWSGVYYVDVDEAARRVQHPRYGVLNGVTRFHGPFLALLGGAHADLGNAYLQHSAHDVAPAPGRAVIFPSWLLHEALPYEGERDRWIVSFNARLGATGGAGGLPFGF